MGIISWIILGLIAGWIASKFVNKSGSGMTMDIALGVVGAIVGGFIASFLGMSGVTGVNIWSIIVSVIGAVVVLLDLPRGRLARPDALSTRRRPSAPPTVRLRLLASTHPSTAPSTADRALPERRPGLQIIHQHLGRRERLASMRATATATRTICSPGAMRP